MLNETQLQENIISLFGLQALPDKQKLAILKKMSDLVQKRIGLRILEKLNEVEQQAFIEASDIGNEEKIKNILDGKKIDMPALVSEETNKLKAEMMGVVGGSQI